MPSLMVEPDAAYWKQLAEEQARCLDDCREILDRLTRSGSRKEVRYWRRRVEHLTIIRDFARWQADYRKEQR